MENETLILTQPNHPGTAPISQLVRRLKIVDATLREGNQAPGVSFSLHHSLKIASFLSEAGIDVIECGHPIISTAEMQRCKAIVDLGLSASILCHARADIRDIDAVKAVGADWIGIFLGVNEYTENFRLPGRSYSQLLDMIQRSVSYARSLGLRVRYTIEDGSRTDSGRLLGAYRAALQAGADRICFADTVGLMSPEQVSERVKMIRSELGAPELEVHIHDDRGLALAGALSAFNAGANWISTSVNGIGERCGITDLCALLPNATFLQEWPEYNAELMLGLSRLVAACTRSSLEDRRVAIGRNAFCHSAKLHVDAVQRAKMSYSWIDSTTLGRETLLATPPRQAPGDLIVQAHKISATELKYHRQGPGTRYVMIDERFVKDCRQYCIVRDIPELEDYGAGHVDSHAHLCDSLFIFIGRSPDLSGLKVEVTLDGIAQQVSSPSSVFIPAGMVHSYRMLSGSGYFINHVLSGDYNSSLLD